MQTCPLPPDGASIFAGMADVGLVMPNGRHSIHLRYEGEPPHGDSYHSIWIDGVRAPGDAWGCQFACTLNPDLPSNIFRSAARIPGKSSSAAFSAMT